MVAVEKLRLPKEIENKMKLWRMGAIPLPQEYINWHKEQATIDMERLKENYIIHKEEMVDDGWLDSVTFLQLIVENKTTRKLAKIKWSDSQHWYEQCTGGGWALIHI